jgi:hypothetical protein
MGKSQLVTGGERDALGEWTVFFRYMQVHEFRGIEYPCATHEDVADGAIDALIKRMENRLALPPTSFTSRKRQRVATGGGGRTNFSGTPRENQLGKFSSLVTWVKCCNIVKMGNAEDKAKLVEVGGCTKHNRYSQQATGRSAGHKMCAACKKLCPAGAIGSE